MGITSDILKRILEWLAQNELHKINVDIEKLKQNLAGQEEDIKHLTSLSEKLIERIARLEGKYENAHVTIRQEIINGLLSGKIKLQQKEIHQLEEKLSANPEVPS